MCVGGIGESRRNETRRETKGGEGRKGHSRPEVGSVSLSGSLDGNDLGNSPLSGVSLEGNGSDGLLDL